MATAVAADHGYVVDIRVFLGVITMAMAASFWAGVSMELMVPIPNVDQLYHEQQVVRDYVVADEQAVLKTNDEEEATTTATPRLPAGQHVLVDLQGVESDFLNSEQRLSRAMEETIRETGLTMLSYHCHSLLPSGVSCVGVLLESHISFHTWPDEGVITLDLFSCGPNPLLPAIQVIERLFGIGENIRSKWSHELRGFRPDEVRKSDYLDDSSDLALWVLSHIDAYSKTQIYSNVTKFQRVDIWDIVDPTDRPSHTDVLKHNITDPNDPRLNSLEFVSPERLLFLDGTLQNVGSFEEVYHEAMVHPAMFAHPGPKNVLILGGGEGATLREVLKHKTVEQVIMIEIDEELVQISREHLASMSDCSDYVGRADNCFDDEIATVTYEDGRKWFTDRYGPSPIKDPLSQPLDVILLDALDPEDATDMSGHLYDDQTFISSIMNSLSDDGVLAIQVGTAAQIDDPKPDYGIYKNREILFNLLEENKDVQVMFVYEEPHCGFLEPHAFLIACKSIDCRSRWYARSDQVEYQIYDRIVLTKSKKRALTYYDGTNQFNYQWPKKGWETVYCRREPMPFECNYRFMDMKAQLHELDLEDEEESSFRVQVSKDDEGEDLTSVFAKVDIPKGSFIMPTHLASSLEVTDRNIAGLQNNVKVGGGHVSVIDDLLSFFDDFAHASAASGSKTNFVEVGGSALIRRVSEIQEANVEKWIPTHPSGKRPKYSPVYERHRTSFDLFIVASRDIAQEEEILMHENIWIEG